MDIKKATMVLRDAYKLLLPDSDPRVTLNCCGKSWHVVITDTDNVPFDCAADQMEVAIAGVACCLLKELCQVKNIKQRAMYDLGELIFYAVGGVGR